MFLGAILCINWSCVFSSEESFNKMTQQQIMSADAAEMKLTEGQKGHPPPIEPGPSSELPVSKPTYKIIVLGNSGVGKTSLTYR